MKSDIFIELFRFNAKTDYLPYYQKYTLQYSEHDTVNDLLNQMNAIEAFGFDENCNLKVNTVYVKADILVSTLVAKFSNEIKIDPISELRAMKDLQIDRSDFLDKLSLVSSYIEAGDNIAYRKSTELAYYASNTLNYNRDYIGDHVLIIAADLIEKNFELKNEIIELLINEENGIWYHTSLENRLLDDSVEVKISKLMYMALEYIKPRTKLAKKVASICNKTSIESFEDSSTPTVSTVAQDFSGFNIAAYHGVKETSLAALISEAKASHIAIPSSKEDLASASALCDDDFSFKIAGDILMQAKDNNADFILVKNDKTKEFFDKNQAKMEKLVGRELRMSVVSQDQFIMLLEGEKDLSKLGFNNHKVDVSFLSNKRVF